MSFGVRMLASSSAERRPAGVPYIPLGSDRPREIRIGLPRSLSPDRPGRKARSRWNLQTICLVVGGVSLLLALITMLSGRAKSVTDPLREYAVHTWDRLSVGTSWLAGQPPSSGPFLGAGAALPVAKNAVLLIKSSALTATERLSWQTLWPRPDIPNRLFYSDAQLALGRTKVIDALQNITSSLFRASDEHKEYLSIHRKLENGEPLRASDVGNKAQLLDKWKVLPMLQHAWTLYPDQKWYIIGEDDTYFFWNTLLQWLSQFDPKSPEAQYFGRPEKTAGNVLTFAHAGAGAVVGGTLMKGMFGADPLFSTKYDKTINKWTCGDCILADVLYQQPSMVKQNLKGNKDLFQNGNVRNLVFTDKLLYSPVLSLDKNDPFDFQGLRVFEEQLLPTLEKGDGVRYCDILEHFASVTLGMNLEYAIKALKEGQSIATAGLDNDAIRKDWYALEYNNLVCGPDCASSRKVPFDATFCAQLCEQYPECLAWTLTEQYCAISRGGFRLGEPKNNVTSGWKMRRIAPLLHAKPCKNKESRRKYPIAAPWS